MGPAGEKISFSLSDIHRKYQKASLDGKDVSSILNGNQVSFRFPGKKREITYLNKLGDMQLTDIPVNPEKYFESCFFAADNNALEVRELIRTGKTKFTQVQACRDAFFNEPLFSGIGVWDKYAFDGNLSTAFKVRLYDYMALKENKGSFRLDMGESHMVDKLVFNGIPVDYNPETVEISNDLSSWHPVKYKKGDGELIIYPLPHEPLRYLRLTRAPVEVAEIQGFINQTSMNRDKWRASNLFGLQNGNAVKLCWRYDGLLNGIAKGAYLSVSVPSNCREGTVYALMILDGKIIAANDRAPSWPYNNWEHYGISEKSITFYIPVDDKMEGKSVQVMLLTTDRNLYEMKPEVWLTNPDIFEKAELILE